MLAAGSATRMGRDKLQLRYKGRRVIDRAVAPFVASRLIDEVIVVVRPGFPFSMDDPKCRVVINADHQQGMGASLHAGVSAAKENADAFVVSLADMPELSVDIIAAVHQAFCRSEKPILVPVHQGRNGHPVVFAGSCREDLLRLGGDVGARSMIREHPELVEYFPTADRAVVHDVDTAEDLTLKQMVFSDADALREATAALRNAAVYFETVDDAGGKGTAIAYYSFDQDKVAAVCSRGRVSEP
ncbi:MAG: nucleotidyltransferase family protein [Phycisphaerales bacterium]|nr:MAG: nucleotidyltransferase family protein [Phycisphaerales bacterium]